MNNNVNIFNKTLKNLGKVGVLESCLFKIDDNFPDDDFTKIYSIGSDSIQLAMDFTNDGIDIHLNGASEVFSWNKSHIKNNTDEIIKTLNIVLTSSIQVDSYGNNYKKFFFKEVSTNKTIKKISVFDGLFINFFKKEKNFFLPIVF
ncbi:MAG: hypothetical protein AAGB12_04685 [Pseudomonadota bacterium]